MSVDKALVEREKTHGDYRDDAAMSQHLKDVMRCSPKWGDLETDMRESLDMIALKIGRILSGNPRHKDHWEDIAG
jgi:hypothetical protein